MMELLFFLYWDFVQCVGANLGLLGPNTQVVPATTHFRLNLLVLDYTLYRVLVDRDLCWFGATGWVINEGCQLGEEILCRFGDGLLKDQPLVSVPDQNWMLVAIHTIDPEEFVLASFKKEFDERCRQVA